MTDRETLKRIVEKSALRCLPSNTQPLHINMLTTELLANGVVVQDDMKEMLGRGLENLYWRIYGANKEFNDRMSAYNPSAFCAGFEYAIQLAKGLLTQLPQPPKEVE